MLLSVGANPFLVDSEGCNSLHIAASKGREDIVRVLMERGMDPNLGVGSDVENS
jgi:ankyrin repeat protein